MAEPAENREQGTPLPPPAPAPSTRARSMARLLVYAVAACGVLFIVIGVFQPSLVQKQKPSWDDFQKATKDYQTSQDKLLELIQKKTGQSGE